MFQTLSYQLYLATEQRPSGLPSAEIATEMRDLRLRLRRAFHPQRRMRPARRPIVLTRALASGR